MKPIKIISRSVFYALLLCGFSLVSVAQTSAPLHQKSAVFMPLPSKEQVAAERVQQRQIEEQKVKYEESIIKAESIQIYRECKEPVLLKAEEKMELKIVEEKPDKKNNTLKSSPENKQ